MKIEGCVNLITGVVIWISKDISREGDQDRISRWLTKGFDFPEIAVLLRASPTKWVVVYHNAEQRVYRTKEATIMATLLGSVSV